MKKFYQWMFALLAMLSISATVSAADFTFTVEINDPAGVDFYGKAVVTEANLQYLIPLTSTSNQVTVSSNSYNGQCIVYAKDGYKITAVKYHSKTSTQWGNVDVYDKDSDNLPSTTTTFPTGTWFKYLMLGNGGVMNITVEKEGPAAPVAPEGNWILVNINNPGTCEFATNYDFTKTLDVADDATSFYYSITQNGSTIYVRPKAGYVFASILEPGSTSPKTTFSAGATQGGQYYSKFLGNSTYGKTMDISTKALNYTGQITINVSDNEANQLTGYFTGLQTPIDFSKATQTLKFDPEYQKAIYFRCSNTAKKCVSAKINGIDVPVTNAYWGDYQTAALSGTDNVLDIQVNEGATQVCTIKYELPEGFEDCIVSIRDVSAAQFLTPTNNEISTAKGSTLRFNFATEGYDFTSFTLNNTDITDKWVNNPTMGSNYLQFEVTEDATLKIEGQAAVYAEIPMTAYVLNPQGVIIKAGTYTDGTPIEMNGTAITENIVLPTQEHTDSEGNLTYVTPSFTLTPENAQKITFTIQDRKYYNAYIAPKQGWYIATVQDNAKAETGYIDKAECQTFYVVALPLPNDKTATINVDLSNDLFENIVLKSNTTLETSWDNPASSYTLINGKNTIKYTEGYQTPFTVASKMANVLVFCEIDQRALPLADAETAVSYQLDLVNNSVVNVSSIDYTAKASTINLVQNNGKTATYTYGPLKRTGENGYKLLNGTQVSVTPGSEDCMLSINGTVVYSPLNNINDLTDGAYTFTINAATTVTVAADAKTYEITKYKPLNGQAVQEFDAFTLTLPALNDDHMFSPDLTALSTITVTPENGSAIEASNVEAQFNDDGSFNYVIEFETIDEPGKYTVNIPAGFFYESEFSEESESGFAAVEGGVSTAAFTSTFIIDPNAPAYHIVPTAGSDVSDLSTFEIVFLDAYMVEENEDAVITLTGLNYNETAGQISQVTGADYITYKISFSNPPATAGEYTLTIPEGSFTIDGWRESEAVTAKYNFTPMWTLTPAPGSVIEDTTFTLEFPSATNAEFVGSRFDLSLTQGETYATPGLDIEKVEGADVPTFTISVNPEAQKAPFGELVLTIDEGAFLVDGETSPFISATYTYEGTASAEYQTDPQGSKLLYYSWGAYMTFIFDETTTVQNFNISSATITVNGTPITCTAETGMNMLMINISNTSTFHDGDILNVKIPAGAFKLSGEDSPEIDRSWTLVPEKTYTFTVNPPSNTTIGGIDIIEVTFNGAESVTVNEASPNVDIKQSYYVVGKMLLTSEDNKLILTADPVFKPTTKGTYTTQINFNQYVIDEVQSYPGYINISYTIDPALNTTTGIVEVTVHEAVNVVSIDGRVIFENADPSKLKTLAPGIYIVNGTKYLVK